MRDLVMIVLQHHRQTARARVGTLRGRPASGALVRATAKPTAYHRQVDLLKVDNVSSRALPGLQELKIEPKRSRR